MKKYFEYMPYALCAVQAVVPVLKIVFYVLGWRAVPVPVFGLIIVAGTMISMILVMANDHIFEPNTAGKIFSDLAIMLGLLGSAIMLGAGGILYTILAVVNALCCFVMSCYAGSFKLLRLIYGFIMCMVIIMAMGTILFSDYGYVDYMVVSRYDSPDGRYTAEIIDSDNMMEGAQVRVQKNTVCGIPVTCLFNISRQVTNSSGDREPGHFVIEWIADDTLSINGYAEELN